MHAGLEGSDTGGGERLRLYNRLVRRNRVVGTLRLVVPIMGLLILGSLMAQIILTSSVPDFGIGRVTVDRDSITVETPQYSGVTSDGGSYTVQALSARARLNAVNTVDLVDASLVLTKLDGVQMRARASSAVLETGLEQVTIPGVTEVSNSEGARGTLVDSFVDVPGERLTASGPVHLVFSDGMTLDAGSLSYDAHAAIWSFSRVTLTVPATPAETTGPLP